LFITWTVLGIEVVVSTVAERKLSPCTDCRWRIPDTASPGHLVCPVPSGAQHQAGVILKTKTPLATNIDHANSD